MQLHLLCLIPGDYRRKTNLVHPREEGEESE